MTDALVAFLRARLDEDEAAARANTGDSGLGDTEDGFPSWPDYQTYDEGIEEASEFIDRFRPLRQLREVEAGRRLIAGHMGASEAHRAAVAVYEAKPNPETKAVLDVASAYLDAWTGATEAKAAVYSDHPDYDPAWRL